MDWTPPKENRCGNCPEEKEPPKKKCGHPANVMDLNCPVCVAVHKVEAMAQEKVV